MLTTLVEVSAPEYTVAREPDYVRIGQRVDRAIGLGLPDGEYLLRALSLDEHPQRTVEELSAIILRTGTDKYDSHRPAVGQLEFAGYDYDIQAGSVEIRDRRLVVEPGARYPTVFGEIVWHFYNGARLDRGRPVRIDLLVLYDPSALVHARKRNPGAKSVRRGLNRFLYKFRDPKHKRLALRGLVRIRR